MPAMPTDANIPATIRSFIPSDQAACCALYVDGLIGGKIAVNDTGYDIDHIEDVYMRSPGNHFWVAEAANVQIVGTIGVQHLEDGIGEIRRLRVRPDYRRRRIGTALLETAVRFCQENGYLKVTLDTFVEREAAISLFEKFQFHLSRTRSVGEKELVYFYLDLYAGRVRPSTDSPADHAAETGGPEYRE
jgi:ribosomal protein S18 acetylase RimI-like enzyme